MSNTNKYSKVISKNVQKNKLNKIKFKTNVNVLNGLVIFLSLLMFVWMFIMLLILPNSNLSTSYLNVTSFYSAKLSDDLSTYTISLTTNGIIFIISIIFYFGFMLFTFFNLRRNINQLKPYKYRKLSFSFFIVYFLIFVLFLIFILIPPSISTVANNIYINSVVEQAKYALTSSNSTEAMKILTNAYNKLGITMPSQTDVNILCNNLIGYSKINNVSITLFTSSSYGYTYFDNSIISIYVLFAISMFLVLFSFIFKLVYANKKSIAPSITKDNIKLIIEAYKQNKKEKKELRKNKKRLIEEENKLLENLYEVDLPNSEEMMKKQVAISQVELEEKMNKNNELKKQLEDLVKQKEELKKESLKKSKLRSFVNKLQENNNSKSRNKKQEIAIPDKELEEIFKSLDIE